MQLIICSNIYYAHIFTCKFPISSLQCHDRDDRKFTCEDPNVVFVVFYTSDVIVIVTCKCVYKKLSYRRETARQLPTWMEGEGLAIQPTPPPPSLVIPVHMVESESHNIRTSSVPSVKPTLR